MSHVMIKKPKMPITRHRISGYVLAFLILNLVFVTTSAFPAQSGDEPKDTSTKEWVLSSLLVHVEQPLHFNQSDDETALISSGMYLVEPITQGEPRLVFWHEQGSVALQATRTTHDQRVETPEAYLIREETNEDIHHVVVFLSDGTAFEAIGSVSGIQTRGNFRVTRHYHLDPATGVVQFGEGLQGRRLPTSQPKVSAQYREGIGSQGSELSMIQLQSVVSQRQQALALAQNLLNSMNGRFQLEEDTDRPGNDYARHMEDSSEACRTRCARDENCQAFTFVKPNPGSTQGQCFLKRSESSPVANHCCVSGTRSSREETILRNIGR